jgi:hypothetical protein
LNQLQEVATSNKFYLFGGFSEMLFNSIISIGTMESFNQQAQSLTKFLSVNCSTSRNLKFRQLSMQWFNDNCKRMSPSILMSFALTQMDLNGFVRNSKIVDSLNHSLVLNLKSGKQNVLLEKFHGKISNVLKFDIHNSIKFSVQLFVDQIFKEGSLENYKIEDNSLFKLPVKLRTKFFYELIK